LTGRCDENSIDRLLRFSFPTLLQAVNDHFLGFQTVQMWKESRAHEQRRYDFVK